MSHNSAHFERYRLKLLPISPIHVGSGQSIEPFEYSLKVGSDKGILRVYDLDRLLASLNTSQREHFYQLSATNFPKLRSWLREQFEGTQPKYQLAIALEAAHELVDSIDDDNRRSEIEMLPRNGQLGRAFLPGSSVKGAIRTALLDQAIKTTSAATRQQLKSIAREAGQQKSIGRQSQLEQQFQATALDYLDAQQNRFPDLSSDPFRQIAISDFDLPGDFSYIDRIKIVKQGTINDQQAAKILMYRELTHSLVLYQDPDGFVESELRLFPQLNEHRDGQQPVRSRISWTEICQACNAFYRPRLENELRDHVRNATVKSRLQEFLSSLQQNECLIRVGRHSHFECVTVQQPFGLPPPRFSGKTRSFAQGLLPLGWAKLWLQEF